MMKIDGTTPTEADLELKRAHYAAPVDSNPILTTRQYAWLTLGFVAFVIYGSLVPLAYQAKPLDQAWNKLIRAFSKPVVVDQPSDWLANILLFIPLGFIAMGWACVDRAKRSAWSSTFVLPACTLLSALLEFAQIWFPPRYTSLSDVVAETIGAAIGIGLWIAAGQRMTDKLRHLWMTHCANNRAIRIVPGYLLLLVIIQGVPFDLTLSPTTLKHKYSEGLISPIPFSRLAEQPLDVLVDGLINAACFLPAGILLAAMPGWLGRGRGSSWKAIVVGFVLAGLITAMQLLVASRRCDATNIVTGSLAVWAGWRLRRPA